MRTLLPVAFSLLAVGCGGKTFDDVPADGGTGDGAHDTVVTIDEGLYDAAPDLTRCTGAGECALVPTACCESCSAATLVNHKSVRKDAVSLDRSLVCGPDPVGCPSCAPMKLDDSIQAVCRGAGTAKRCTAIDVRLEPVSECATNADCVLRSSGCCQECAPTRESIIAINPARSELWRAEVCVGDEACPRCATRPPPGIGAICDTSTHHCRVIDLVGG